MASYTTAESGGADRASSRLSSTAACTCASMSAGDVTAGSGESQLTATTTTTIATVAAATSTTQRLACDGRGRGSDGSSAAPACGPPSSPTSSRRITDPTVSPSSRGSGTGRPLIGQHGDRPVLGGTSAQAAELVRHSTYHEGGQPMVQQSSGDGSAQVVGKEGARLGGGAIATLVGLAGCWSSS